MNFRYLDELIHKGAMEVVLDCDIAYDDGTEYYDGIQVDVDGLVINGNGHTIDARGKAGIFNCIGRGIIMKDLTFKNAFLFENCCAISNSGDLSLINCRFISNANESNVWGGAIFNEGMMAVEKCSFEENSTSDEGGAIKNYGWMTVSRSAFMRNSACDGGAIFNLRRGNLKLVDSTFIANEASSSVGNDIMNSGKIAIQDCDEFSSNDIVNEGFIIASPDVLDTVLNSGNMAELKLPGKGQRDFTYLKGLIDEGCGEIILEHDIILNFLKDEEKTFHDGIEILKDGLTINGNGHTIDARQRARIFMCRANNIVIKNFTFSNGSSNEGGAIYNAGDLTISRSTFSGNETEYGGAAYNKGDMTIVESAFLHNRAYRGGALYNHGKMSLKDVEIEGNESKSSGGSDDIHNTGRLFISGTEGSLSAEGSASILNRGLIGMSEANKDMYSCSGQIIIFKSLEKGQKNFSCLDKIIKSGAGEINLENDFILDVANDEAVTFAKGIEIDRNGLVINGNGHTIDARRFSRIFNCKGRGIVLKDVKLLNGFCASDGGALQNTGDLTICGCDFKGNVALGDVRGGGAIFNGGGNLHIHDCDFTQNHAERRSGGGIFNSRGLVRIEKSTFFGNEAELGGGAIENRGKMHLIESKLRLNSSTHGGAIGSADDLIIILSTIVQNSAYDAGAINNIESNLEIEESVIEKNESRRNGGAIVNHDGSIMLHDVEFKSNESQNYGGAICNHRGRLEISKSLFCKNSACDNGGAIKSSQNLSIRKCSFSKNSSEQLGGAIYHEDGEWRISQSLFDKNDACSDGGAIKSKNCNLVVSNAQFERNRAKRYGGAIRQYDGNLDVFDSVFEGNSAGNGGGIRSDGVNLNIRKSLFHANVAKYTGGAIGSEECEQNMLGSEFKENIARHCGAIYLRNSRCESYGCTFRGNEVEDTYPEGAMKFFE